MNQPRSPFITALGDFIMALFPSYPNPQAPKEEEEEDKEGTPCPFCKQSLPLTRALRRDHYDNACPAKTIVSRSKRKRSSPTLEQPRKVKRQRRLDNVPEYEVERISEHQNVNGCLLFHTHWKNACDGVSDTWEPRESFVTLWKGKYVDVNATFTAYVHQHSLRF
jgi:hypothetical protein